MDTAGTDQDGFSHSRERFEQVLAFMGGNHAAALTHAELEDHLDTLGRALLRQLYQDHLDLRALGEARLDGVADAEVLDTSSGDRKKPAPRGKPVFR